MILKIERKIMTKKRNSLFLLSFILLGMIFNIKTEDEQNVFNDAQNVAVKRFVSSRAGNIQKDQKKIEEHKTFTQRLYERWLKNFPKLAEKKLTLHEIYENILKACTPSANSSILSAHAFTDLDLVREDGNDIISIFTNYIGTQTQCGEVATFLATLYPTSDAEILKTRQKFIQALEADTQLLQEIEKIIVEIKKIENELISNSFGDLINEFELRLIKSTFIKTGNKKPSLWWAEYTLGLTAGLAFFPGLGLLAQCGSLFLPSNFISKFYGILEKHVPLARIFVNALLTPYNIFLISTFISLINGVMFTIKKAQQKLISFATTLSAAEKLHTLLKKSNLLTEEFKKAIPALTSLEQFINDPELKTIKQLLH
jgi:hypothetical protein